MAGMCRGVALSGFSMLAELPVGSIIKLSLLLVVLVVAGWVTVLQVRRRLTSPDETSGVGFTLSDLRQLHRSGQMSDEEFERAKAKVVDAAKRVAELEAQREALRNPSAAAGWGRRAAGGGAMRPPRDESENT